MPDYHIYCIDDKNRVVSRHDAVVRDDITAFEKANELCGANEVEVWQGTRLVARLAAKDGTASMQAPRVSRAT